MEYKFLRTGYDLSQGLMLVPVSRNTRKELGFYGAEGISNYVDGALIPDHGCQNWPQGVTYTIPMENTLEFLYQNTRFAERVWRGELVYVEGHFCINDRKYFNLCRNGTMLLTDYARTHIDECCVPFRVTGNRANGSFSNLCAARGKTKEVKDHNLRKEGEAVRYSGAFYTPLIKNYSMNSTSSISRHSAKTGCLIF